MDIKKRFLCFAILIVTLVSYGRTTFCNPVDIPYRYSIDRGDSDGVSFREAADPTIVNFKGRYYLFASKCGDYYYSDNLIDWTPVHTDDLPMEGSAPTVAEMNGALYFTHSVGTTRIWRSTNPMSGKWELIEGAGTPTDENDPMLFSDYGRMYLFYGSSGNPDDGILGVELDTVTMRPKGNPVRLLSANPSRFGWEVPGDYNDSYNRYPWIEGVWVNKLNGKYYLQYSAPGTEFKSYCDAVYVSDNPLGPYVIQKHNPFSYRPEGFIASSGHGSTFEDNYGNLWHVSTGTISRRHMFERRLVLYPVFLDNDGLLFADTSYGDYPIFVPKKKASSPNDFRSGSMLVSYRCPVKVSSYISGHPGEYAVNEDIRSWWSAASGAKGEYIMLELGQGTTVSSVQVNFADEGSELRGRNEDPYKYRLEVSDDCEHWKTIADCNSSSEDNPHVYIELDQPVTANYIKLTNIEDCPSGNFSVSGLRVFGKRDVRYPSATRFKLIQRNADDPRMVTLEWEKSEGAVGYNIRFGTHPDKLYNSYMVYSDSSAIIRSLDSQQDYYFALDAFNEVGIKSDGEVYEARVDTSTFTNPVIYADVPDPDVIRVGDTFYMVSTTMHFSPGCTLMKSSDLVNWEVFGYAYDQLEESDCFALKNGQNDYAKGSWAANLRYDSHEGRFYLIVSCNTTQKTYIFTTTDIEKGHWHRNEVEMCYDPGLLFDDNGKDCRKYVVYPDYDLGRYECNLREIISDGKGNVVLGKPEILIDYTQIENPAQGLRAEGYHGYKIGDYYYIFMIQGQGWQRQQIVWRSRELRHGTFESRKVFAGNIVNPDGSPYLPFTGIAQGGIVEIPSGDWYAMLFQDYGAVGRLPVLIPMEWRDDWPVIGNNGTSVDRRLPLPVPGSISHFPVVSDEFDNNTSRYVISDTEPRSPEYQYYGSNLRPEWQWNHNPDNRFWSLTERPGFLRLATPALATSIRDARNTLTQRTFGPTSMAETLLEVSGMKDGDVAGLASFQNQYGYVGVKRENGITYIVMHRSEHKDDSKGQEIERKQLETNRVWLRVECDFRHKADTAYFYYSLDGQHWTRIGDKLTMNFDWPDFVGQRFALFNFATVAVGGYADFDYFHVSKEIRAE